MVTSWGWEQEPTLLDALSGSGGTADPLFPLLTTPASDVFLDALSAGPMTFSPLAVVPVPAVPLPAVPVRAVPVRAVPTARPARAPSRPAPARTPAPVARASQPARAWAQLPPPGGPAAQYVPVPMTAQLAPPSGRRPQAIGPTPVRTQAPTPQQYPQARTVAAQPDLVQLRAAVQRQTATSRNRSPRANSRKSKASGIWSLLVFVAVLLLSSGLGQKIVSAISELLQRK